MLGYFFGYLLTEKITQHDQKCPPELRFSAGVQHESCLKKWKKIVGVDPRGRRCQTTNSGGVMLGYFLGYLLTEKNNPTWRRRSFLFDICAPWDQHLNFFIHFSSNFRVELGRKFSTPADTFQMLG